MCGINGIVHLKQSSPEELKEQINSMVRAIKHRGPDEQEICVFPHAALAVNRLAIIAPKEHVTVQKNHNNFYSLFNGEIVNYKNLRHFLNNPSQYGDSDTGLILPLYEKLGPSFIKHLAGMFAIAVYDDKNNLLHLWRDPLGIKPLYYYYDNSSIIFSSEIKAIYQALWQKPSISFAAIDHILRFRFHPGRDTIFSSIHRVLPGEHITFSRKGIQRERYWNLANNSKVLSKVSQKEHQELLSSIVKENAYADVPGGFFVSGGLDSSLVTVLAKQFNSSYSQPISISFLPHPVHDETYGKLLEKNLKTSFSWVTITDEAARDALTSLVPFMDEPLENPIHVGTFLMAKRAHELGIKSVITGDGSDEFFLGYERHVPWFTKTPKEAQEEYPRWLWTEKPEEANELYSSWAKEHTTPMIDAQKTVLEPFTDIEKVLRFERWERLQEYHCTRLDRMTMAWGVEAKVPFLDHRLVEYTLKVPLKTLFGTTGKGWLQGIASDYLPPEIIHRPKVHFPSLPDQWLTGKGIFWMREVLLSPHAKIQNLFDRPILERYIQEHEKGTIKHGRLLWAIMALELWLEGYPSASSII